MDKPLTSWDAIARIEGRKQITYPRTPLDIDHLSHSAVQSFLRCPRQWAYAYLEGLRRPPGVALIKGSAVDKAAAFNLRQKISTRTDLPKEDVLEVAEAEMRKDVDENGGASEIDWAGTSYPRALDSAIGLTEIHLLHHAPHIQPRAVQLELHRPLPDGRDFVGYIDFVEEEGSFGDVKTGSRRMGQAAADTDAQPSAYAYLAGEPIAFKFWRAIDSGQRRNEEVIGTLRLQNQIDWYETNALEVSKAINSGIYPARTDSWACSPRYCGYWQRCQVENRPPEFPHA